MNSTTTTCPALPDHPVAGQNYERPCIRAQWQNMGPLWLPVIGSIHSDVEYIKADFPHVHVDYRFLTETTRDILLKQMEEKNLIFNIHPVHTTPISTVWPDCNDTPLDLSDPSLATIPETTWLTVQLQEYIGPYPDYPEHLVPWHRELSAAYARQSLVNSTFCPHQGTDLSGIEPDRHGVVTCPLHGLKWSTRTGRIVMPRT